MQHLFPVPLLIAYRQPPNFKRILTSNKNPQPHPGNSPCNTPRCQLCVHIRTDNVVTGPNNYKFTIRQRFTCISSNVVYLLSCLLCPKAIYIGETGNTIRKRINGHKSDIRKKINKPVAKNFNLPEHSVSHLQVSILKRTITNPRQRQIEEQKLMSKFNCIQEGLNKDSGFLSHYLKNYNWPLTISTLLNLFFTYFLLYSLFIYFLAYVLNLCFSFFRFFFFILLFFY